MALTRLRAFITVVKASSFAAEAQKRGLTCSAIGNAVAKREARWR